MPTPQQQAALTAAKDTFDKMAETAKNKSEFTGMLQKEYNFDNSGYGEAFEPFKLEMENQLRSFPASDAAHVESVQTELDTLGTKLRDDYANWVQSGQWDKDKWVENFKAMNDAFAKIATDASASQPLKDFATAEKAKLEEFTYQKLQAETTLLQRSLENKRFNDWAFKQAKLVDSDKVHFTSVKLSKEQLEDEVKNEIEAPELVVGKSVDEEVEEYKKRLKAFLEADHTVYDCGELYEGQVEKTQGGGWRPRPPIVMEYVDPDDNNKKKIIKIDDKTDPKIASEAYQRAYDATLRAARVYESHPDNVFVLEYGKIDRHTLKRAGRNEIPIDNVKQLDRDVLCVLKAAIKYNPDGTLDTEKTIPIELGTDLRKHLDQLVERDAENKKKNIFQDKEKLGKGMTEMVQEIYRLEKLSQEGLVRRQQVEKSEGEMKRELDVAKIKLEVPADSAALEEKFRVFKAEGFLNDDEISDKLIKDLLPKFYEQTPEEILADINHQLKQLERRCERVDETASTLSSQLDKLDKMANNPKFAQSEMLRDDKHVSQVEERNKQQEKTINDLEIRAKILSEALKGATPGPQKDAAQASLASLQASVNDLKNQNTGAKDKIDTYKTEQQARQQVQEDRAKAAKEAKEQKETSQGRMQARNI